MADNNNKNKPKVIRFNFSWLYVILIAGIGWMLLNQGSANPQKVEWAEVQAMIEQGDVDQIEFVRNDYQGYIKIRPERLAAYSDKFGGEPPRKSPHFFFLVSDKFNPEERFAALNESLPAESRFKLVIKSNDRTWTSLLEWLIWPILLVLMWVWMFRGFNKNMGGAVPSGNASSGVSVLA